jgi:thioesterase domain-containing protein
LGRCPLDRYADFRKLRVNANRALRIVRNIWRATAVELPINVFFEAPNIARMAAILHEGRPILAADFVRLRDGDETMPLFLFAGGVGVLLELEDLVRALDYPGVIYGIPFSGLDGVGPILKTVELEAARSCAIIRRLKGSGPFCLVGYSFGGITALEIARRLRDMGDDGFVGMIDSAQNDHAWPLDVWLGFILRKLGRKLLKVFARLPATAMRHHSRAGAASAEADPVASEQRPRGTQLEFRFRDPTKPDYPYYHPYWRGGYPPNYGEVAKNVCRLRGLHMPEQYDGNVTFFASIGGDPLVCDPRQVWPAFLPNAEWVCVPGNHLSMIVGRNAAALAREISSRLKQLIVTSPQAHQSPEEADQRFTVCESEVLA